jgi:chromosome segregation ATPase
MAQPAPARPTGGDTTQAPETVRLAGLGNRFVELFGRKLTRQDFAGEIARLIAAATRVKAVAILGLEVRRDHLRLLGECGLSSDARAALGGGGECQWDIPLRGLRNRRISVISAAHQNPFVPRALVTVSLGGLSIASLPIYNDQEPTGVVLLFATGNRTFPDGQLQALSQALRVCARGLRDQDSTATRPGAAARDTAAIAAAIAELAGETAPGAPAAGATVAPPPIAEPPADERAQRLEQALAQVREELERTAAKLRTSTASANAVVRERDRLAQHVTELESARETVATELRAELSALQERLLAVESERARYQRIADERNTRSQQTIKSLGSERDSLLERVQTSESRVTLLDGELATVKGERARLNAQVDNLTAQLRTTQEAQERAQARHADERTAIESDREGWKDQAAALRNQLTQRSEELAALDREFRGTTVARDGAIAQLQAARAELERLATVNEDAGRSLTSSEAARASALAEGASLRRTLEQNRAEQTAVEQQLRTELDATQADAGRLRNELDALRSELDARTQSLGARDQQLTLLRLEFNRTQETEAAWQQTRTAQLAEIATLTARLEHLTADHQQLLDDRATSRAALAEARQRTTESDVAHAATVAELQSEGTQLRRQLETLTGDRTALAGRLDRAVEEAKTLTRGRAEAQRRVEDLTELLRQRDAAVEAAAVEREQLAAQVAALTGQLQAGQEAWQRTHAHDTQARAALEADRDEWKAQASTAGAELVHASDRVIALEGELRGAVVARDATAAELQSASAEVDRLSALNDELAYRAAQLEAAQAAAAVESGGLRRTLDEERTTRINTEQTLQHSLAVTQAEAERLAAEAAALRAEVAELMHTVAGRDQQLAALRSEIDLLRQQSVDRGVLAHQANELGARVVELEQQLAAARSDGARAERQRATLAEQLEAGRRRETELLAVATREQAALQEALQVLTAERDRLHADKAAQRGESEAQQVTITELQSTLERLRGERTHAQDAQHDTARRLAATQRQLDEVTAALRQREAEVATHSSERERLAAQLDTVLRDAEAGRQALEAEQTRFAQERAAIEADRDRWKNQMVAAQNEHARLARSLEDLGRTAADLEAARAAAKTERAALLEGLETERAAAEGLRADRAAMQAEIQRLASDAATLRTAATERDEQLATVQQRETTLTRSTTALQETIAALRTESEKLTGQLEERTTEVQQLRDGQAALERQLALVVATHGQEEQALANGMQAAREQVAQLEQERTLLRATLTELRQQLSSAQAAQTAQVTAAEADTAELRKQIKSLSAHRTNLTKRVAQAEKELAAQAERADAEGRRAQTLGEQNQQLQQQLAAAHSERTTVDQDLVRVQTDLGRLTAQSQESAAERDRLRDEHSAIERQLAQLEADASEHERVWAQQLETARTNATRLEQERAAARATLAELEQRFQQTETTQAAALAQVQSDADTLREQLTTLRTARDELSQQLTQAEHTIATQSAHVDTEGRRVATLAEQNTQLQQALAAAEQRHTALDGVLKQARAEIEALRQQSEDRGVLAHEASELGARVVELEQQLAGVRGEAAHAERQRESLAEELDALRRQQSEADATVGREQAKLRATIERLTEERRRLESEHTARAAEAESQRVALAELQATLARAEEGGQAAAQRLADSERRAEAFTAQLRQREAAIVAANAERQRLTTQVAKLTAQVRASQETLDAVQGRSALERAAIEAERESFKEKLEADRAELQHRAALNEQLTQHAAQLEAGRSAAASEVATLRATLEELRATHRHAEEVLRADVVERQSEAQRVSSELLALRGELAERDEQLAILRQEQEAAQQNAAQRQHTIVTLRGQLVASNAHIQQAAAEYQQLHDEREAVQRQLALIEAARGEEEQALTQGLQAARAQIAQLEQERADARAALADARERLAQAESVHAETQTRIQTEMEALRQQVTTLGAARATFAQRVEQTEQALRQQAEQAQVESGRAQASTERCAELEQTLLAVDSQRTALDADVRRMSSEIEALRQHSADRGALARQTSELNSTIGTLEQQLAEMRSAAAHAERQRAALTQEIEAARQEHARALEVAEQQQSTLQETLRQLTDERARLVAERTAQQHQLETQRITLAELQAALEQTQTERQRVEDDGHDTAQRLAEMHRRVEELSERVRQRDATVEATAAERQQLEDAIRAAEAKAVELSSECDLWRRRAELGNAGGGRLTDPAVLSDDFVVRMAREDAAPPVDAPLIIERSAPLDALLDAVPEPVNTAAPEPEPEAELQGTARSAGEMVLLDVSGRGDEAYSVLKGAGFEVSRAAPSDATVDDLARRKISCVMLNLAAGPAAWRTLKTLRERTGTRAVPLLAYLMGPDAQKGFCFGRADFGMWPMDGERLTDRLTQLRPKLKRLLAVSADIDGMGRLREPFTKAGISTSSVLDGKQALEFATMVEPEAALFHLSPTCTGVARAITALRASEGTRDLPMVVLLDKAPAREEAFYAITVRELINKGTFQFANLPGEIARLLA